MIISRKSLFIISLFIVLLAHGAYSQPIYKWVDDQGNIHFTTKYEGIPPEYRSKFPKPERVEEVDSAKKSQREKEAISSPVIPPTEETAGVRTTPSLSQSQETSREEENKTKPRIRVEFEGRYWVTDLTAEGKVTESGIGTKLDFEEDLGIKDENLPEGRFTWYTGPNSKLRLTYTQVAYSGDKNIERTIEFGGKTYTVGTRVKTDVDLIYVRLGWAWQFIDIARGTVKLGTLLEAKGFWLDISLDAPNLTPPVEASEGFIGALPTVGLALDINPHRILNIFAEASGIYAGNYGYFLDGEAGVKIIPIKNLSLFGGYRILDFRAEDDPDFAKLRILGPFAGITLRF